LTFKQFLRIIPLDMESLTLNAQVRTTVGKRVKDVRIANSIPAVVYGHGLVPRAISVPVKDFRKVYATAGSSSLVDLVVDGAAPIKTIVHEVQPHHLTMEPLHIDFYQVRMDEKMSARIPLRFTGESDAVKALGGTLMKSMDTVEVECLPADLPHEIVVDISLLKTFEDAIMVSGLPVSSAVTIVTEHHLTIASVTPPLTEEQLKKMEESQVGDIAVVKTEAEEKKAEEDAKKAAEGAGDDKDKKDDKKGS
jgi:large subunit ribosomal protein L25